MARLSQAPAPQAAPPHTTEPQPVGAAPPAGFLRMPSVIRLTGLGRSTIYRLIAERQFPSPVQLGKRAVGGRRADLERWSETRASTAH